jgi:hypothetical protein
MSKLKKDDKKALGLLFQRVEVIYKDTPSSIYIRVNPNASDSNNKIFSCLETIGYNHLSVYNFL